MSKVTPSEIEALKSRLLTVANQFIDQYQVQQSKEPKEGDHFNRMHFGEFAAVAASISMLTFAGAYERMSDTVTKMTAEMTKKVLKTPGGMFS